MFRLMMLLALALAVFCYAADQFNSRKTSSNIEADTTAANDTATIKQYWLVLLKRAAQQNDALQQVSNVESVGSTSSNAFVLSGRISDHPDYVGMYIIDAADSLAAVQLVAQDEAVTTSGLSFEIHRWWAQKGAYVLK